PDLALHPRSDEADERGQVRPGRDRPRRPRRERAASRVRAAALRARAAERPPARRALVARPAPQTGPRNAIMLRDPASSVAPGHASPNAPCVLVSLDARAPGIRLRSRTSH